MTENITTRQGIVELNHVDSVAGGILRFATQPKGRWVIVWEYVGEPWVPVLAYDEVPQGTPVKQEGKK